MSYCKDSSKATVIYKFNDTKEKRYTVERDNLPVEVVKEKATKIVGVKADYEQGFDGYELGTHEFTVIAPSQVPKDAEVEIYLESGAWDDYGEIGSYSTGYGIVEYYNGEPLLIGSGHQINGSVTNVMPIHCYVKLTLDWRYDDGCKLVISHAGKTLYEEIGQCPLEFEVVCDDDCPKGYLRCPSNKYPGYCCIPCKETASKIRALGNKL